MTTRKKTKLLMSSNSQAVRIPREFQLEGDEVEIQRPGNTLTDSLAMFTDDFMEEGRQQPPPQKRKSSFSCS